MPTPLQWIQLRCPDAAADVSINTRIEYASGAIGTAWGAFTEQAIALTVLHEWTLDKRTAEQGTQFGGRVITAVEGDLRLTYEQLWGADSSYNYFYQTNWGMQLYELRKKAFFGPRTRIAM